MAEFLGRREAYYETFLGKGTLLNPSLKFYKKISFNFYKNSKYFHELPRVYFLVFIELFVFRNKFINLNHLELSYKNDNL